MALANIAWILASAGRRVIAIDWDLEAPGLSRYYHPFLRDPEMSQTEGLIDFLLDFIVAAQTEGSETSGKWFEPYANLTPYTVPIEWEFGNGGALHLVSAGRQDAGYATRVTEFNWQSFYSKVGGGVFLEAVKRRLRNEYDYILIDSRTGLSDTSGICSVQMPDDLICCFTLNSQSILGAAATANSACQQRIKANGEPGLRIWPVPTRVELHERDRLETAREIARTNFAKFLTHLPRNIRSSYLTSVEVLYQPYFAYEEVLATIADRRNQTGSLLGSFEQICRWITDGEVTHLETVKESHRLIALNRFRERNKPRKVKVYLPLPFVPGWFVRYAVSAEKLLGGGSQLPSYHLWQLLIKHFGEANILVRQEVATVVKKSFINVTVGSIAQANVVLFIFNAETFNLDPDAYMREFPEEEINWAITKNIPIIPIHFEGEETTTVSIPSNLRHLFRRGIYKLKIGDLENNFLQIRDVIEEAARESSLQHTDIDPDDPHKGRWGSQSGRKGYRLSASVRPISADWFSITMQVTGETLIGDVTFHLHPTFQPDTMTVSSTKGRAEVEVMAYGAFTVGAVINQDQTFLELDLAEIADAPAAFRAR